MGNSPSAGPATGGRGHARAGLGRCWAQLLRRCRRCANTSTSRGGRQGHEQRLGRRGRPARVKSKSEPDVAVPAPSWQAGRDRRAAAAAARLARARRAGCRSTACDVLTEPKAADSAPWPSCSAAWLFARRVAGSRLTTRSGTLASSASRRRPRSRSGASRKLFMRCSAQGAWCSGCRNTGGRRHRTVRT